MMRGLAGTLEKHHKVRILDEAVEDAVKLSHRYITDRQLPDKSVSLLDTACARVALSQIADAAGRSRTAGARSSSCDVEIGILERESRSAPITTSGSPSCSEKQAAARNKLAALEKRWAEEKNAGRARFRSSRAKLDAHARRQAETPRPSF